MIASNKRSGLSRRDFLQRMSIAALAASVPSRLVRAADALSLKADPFVLGVASGCPTNAGVVLWTRLIGEEIGNTAVPVSWEVASDERMRRIVRRGTEYASPEWAHSVHVEIEGLEAGREYWYRFATGGYRSRVGRMLTAPQTGARSNRLRVAVASCQKYETGYFTPYRHMLADELDLIVHTGDYIYEYASRGDLRGDGSDGTLTLEDYRARHALYKTDPDLQAVHALCPWLFTWDDHEVANDYAGGESYEQSGEEFLARRAAAYRAYYEHMPLPRSARPVGPNMLLYQQATYGDLLQVHVLDSRQYRSPLACLQQEGGAKCVELFDAARTKLGRQQEDWLTKGLADGRARWNLIAQGTPIAHVDQDSSPGVAYRRDAWDGYPAARQRLLDALVGTRAGNPIVVDGDIHAFQVANVNAQPNDIGSPVVASEFTVTSITSQGIGQRGLDERRRINPNILLSDASRRGYLLMDFARERMQCDLVTVDTVREREATRGLLARYVVENGKPGPIAA
jgi:alkaline phosphatase D